MRQIRADLLGRGHEAEGVPRGVGIDQPSLGARIQNVGHWARTRLLNHKAGVVQILDEEIKMRLLLSVLARPRRTYIGTSGTRHLRPSDSRARARAAPPSPVGG